MKRLHLICNSHLDPVWQWDWPEGIAATIATFYQATKFCDEYDYIFCHGESILYEWIEKYDKQLFDKISFYFLLQMAKVDINLQILIRNILLIMQHGAR